MTRPSPSLGRRGLVLLAACLLPLVPLRAAPLRVLVASDSAAVRDHYAAALQQGGAGVTSAPLPDTASLAGADVLLLHRSKLEPLPAAARQAVSEFARRGGGIVAVHGAVAAGDAAWGKATLGGAWDPAASAKFRSVMMLSVRPDAHPLVQDAAQFDVDDDTLYDLSLADNLTVLGAAFTPKVTRAGRRQQADRASIYDIQPQLWAFEGPQHRAVVLLQGGDATLKHASIRAFLLRGVAWSGRRGNVDELCAKADLASLRYPAGGPRPADETVRQFELQPGFRATVVATEPLINKPIAIAWDARGRLWVAETPEYPNGRRPLTAPSWKEGGVLDPGKYERPARDRISILEDTDGDGRMDRKTVFHEGLELITGFCMHRDGVIVVAQPNVVWLRDTNGDDRADQEQPVFGGFTPGDTHFVANHFIPAPDGWIYASTGSGATATKPGTKEAVGRVSSGLFRFKADGSAIEQVGSSGGNTFGADVTSDLELFHGKATSGNPLQHVVLPEWVLAKAGTTSARAMQNINPGRTVARADLPDRAPLMQIDQVGRYSAACASLVAEGGAWPAEYRDTIFVTEPILDIIHHERLVPKGPTLAGELVLQKGEWLRSRDYWFTPVTLAWGPDGAMYVLDFYTPVVAHNDTRGPQHSRSGASVRPDREHYYGRIYRIQHEAAPRLAHPDLTRADAAALVAAFRHPNRTVRFNALRVLVEKADTVGAAAGPALRTMASGEKFVPARLQALWALQRLGRLDADVFAAALRADEAAVRKNALLIAEAARRPLTTAEVTAALEDRDERVRLTALRAMTAAPGTVEATEVLLARQPKLEDPWSKAAASAAAAANPGLLLGQVLAKGEGQEDFARSLAASVAGANDGSAGRVVVAAAQSRNTKLAAAVLDELGRRPPAPPADRAPALAALGRLLASPEADLALSALPLAVAWDADGSLRPAVTKVTGAWLAVAKDASQPAARRSQAVRAMLSARAADPAVLPALLALADRPQPEAFRRELIAGLAATGDPAVGRAWVASFAGWPTALRALAFDALASRPAWATLVLDALDTGKLSPAVLSPLQASRLAAHPDPALAARAKALLARLGSGANPAKDEILARLRPEVEKPGNAANGKAVFAANCASCHRLAGQGYELGPDLDGIGSHPAAELLVHIVDPNRMVDDEHRTWNFTLKDGTQHSALMAGENAATVRLRMAAGVALDVPVADIVRRDKSPNSLMPEGLEALGGPALRDVIAYIRGFAPGADAPVVMTGTAEGGQVVPASALRGELRPLSLAGAYTADTRQGLYASTNAVADTFPFVKFGRVTANGVPFEIADPARSADGRNVIVLRGGPEGSFARTLPRRVEIPVGLAAARLHFLGGVAGWGGGPGGNTPVMKVTLHYAGGQTQVAELRAGREFVDYIRRMDVPGSQYADGVVREKQLRTFAVPVRQPGLLEKVVLESAGNRPAPTTVAITAELRGP